MEEATGVLRPAPNVLPTTLENSHSGYAFLKTFATECSKLPTANPDFVTARDAVGVKELTPDSERTIWIDGEEREIGPVSSDYRHWFGVYTGTLPGSIELDEAPGVRERHDALWLECGKCTIIALCNGVVARGWGGSLRGLYRHLGCSIEQLHELSGHVSPRAHLPNVRSRVSLACSRPGKAGDSSRPKPASLASGSRRSNSSSESTEIFSGASSSPKS